jgi:hypothetical protein
MQSYLMPLYWQQDKNNFLKKKETIKNLNPGLRH